MIMTEWFLFRIQDVAIHFKISPNFFLETTT